MKGSDLLERFLQGDLSFIDKAKENWETKLHQLVRPFESLSEELQKLLKEAKNGEEWWVPYNDE